MTVDCIRPRVWQNPNVAGYFAQNTLLFVVAGRMERGIELKAEMALHGGPPLSLVHPDVYLNALSLKEQSLAMRDPRNMGNRKVARLLPSFVRQALARRLAAEPASWGGR
jgi:hypothetical protein